MAQGRKILTVGERGKVLSMDKLCVDGYLNYVPVEPRERTKEGKKYKTDGYPPGRRVSA